MRIGSKITAGIGSMAALLAVTCGLSWTLASQQISGVSSERSALVLNRDVKQYQVDAAGVAVAENLIAYDLPIHSDPSADLRGFAQATSAAEADAVTLQAMNLGAIERSELTQASKAIEAYIAQSNTINAQFNAGTKNSIAAANADVANLNYSKVIGPLGQLERLDRGAERFCSGRISGTGQTRSTICRGARARRADTRRRRRDGRHSWHHLSLAAHGEDPRTGGGR